MKHLISVFLLLSVVNLTWAAAATIQLRSNLGTTKFKAIGKPAMLRITGEGPGPTGEIRIENKKVSGMLLVDLKGLNTGIALRDEHMKNKYLLVGTYPTAKLTLQNLELTKAPAEINEKMEGLKFKGLLSLHGIEKPMEGTFEIEPSGTNLKIKAQSTLSLADYNIEIPSYAGIKVADTVTIEIDFSILK